jgi:hypothetical protein
MRQLMVSTPTPQEIAAIEYEARRMRAEFVGEGARRLWLAIRRLVARQPRAEDGTARA